MKKWLWVGAGTVAALALGFVLYQSLFGNTDEALEVKHEQPPVVQKAKVNKKNYEMIVYIPNKGGFLSTKGNGTYNLQLESDRNHDNILNVPAKLMERVPVVGTKLWITFEIDNKLGVHKATGMSMTPPNNVPAGQVVLFGEYDEISQQPAGKKTAYNVFYGTFDEAKQKVKDVLTYSPKEEIKEPRVCHRENSNGDICLFQLYSRIKATLNVDEFGQVTIKQMVKAEDAQNFVELYPAAFTE